MGCVTAVAVDASGGWRFTYTRVDGYLVQRSIQRVADETADDAAGADVKKSGYSSPDYPFNAFAVCVSIR